MNSTDIANMMRQRLELKRRDPDEILLFRVKEDKWGDHYQAFEEDALAIHEMRLGELANRMLFNVAWPGSPVNYVRVWPDVLDALLAAIVKAGKWAAVYEQVQGPAPAGVTVERVVTEGAFDDD